MLIDPKVSDFNVRMFLSFVQADGFNPLIVASTNFKALDVSSLIEKLQISAESVVKARTLLSKPFRIGQLFKDMKDAKVTSSLSKEEQLQIIMTASKQEFAGLYSQNGYWADHWTYTLDLVENFLAVYPDQEERMLYDSVPLPFFMSPAIVKPRSERYVVVNITTSNTTETAVRVYSAVAVKGDPTYPAERTEALANFAKSSSYIADINSQGGIWQQTRTNQTMYVSAIAKVLLF